MSLVYIFDIPYECECYDRLKFNSKMIIYNISKLVT